MSEDMSNIMGKINEMISNNQIPDDVMNMISNFTNNSDNTKNEQDNSDSSSQSSDSSSIPNFDINTMMKMQKIIGSMNSNKDDPRANLLRSLKPYLKDSRKDKVDQYIQIFGMGKVFEMLNPLGGEDKK